MTADNRRVNPAMLRVMRERRGLSIKDVFHATTATADEEDSWDHFETWFDCQEKGIALNSMVFEPMPDRELAFLAHIYRCRVEHFYLPEPPDFTKPWCCEPAKEQWIHEEHWGGWKCQSPYPWTDSHRSCSDTFREYSDTFSFESVFCPHCGTYIANTPPSEAKA